MNPVTLRPMASFILPFLVLPLKLKVAELARGSMTPFSSRSEGDPRGVGCRPWVEMQAAPWAQFGVLTCSIEAHMASSLLLHSCPGPHKRQSQDCSHRQVPTCSGRSTLPEPKSLPPPARRVAFPQDYSVQV